MSDGHAPDDEQIERLNQTVRYTVWAVYARSADSAAVVGDGGLGAWAATLPADDVVHALRTFRRTAAGAPCTLAWSAMGTHRPAEFSRDHVPSFMQDTEPLPWLCMYPFVRSYEWYLLPDDERRAMLREHGVAGRVFTEVQPNTVAAFALNDYEWILALESVNLHDLVDMMRDLRATEARRHVREEIPFYTGRLVDTDGAAEVLR
jgi:peroxiredoxin